MKRMILATALVVVSATAATAQVGYYIPNSCGCATADENTPWGHQYCSNTSTTSTTTTWTHTSSSTVTALQPYQQHNTKWPTMSYYGYTSDEYFSYYIQYYF